MTGLVVVFVLVYAVVNAFGAWAVIRRKPWVAGLFMLAATLLTVAAVAIAYVLPLARWLLLAGLTLASLSSFLNARIVLGRVVWRYHLIRGAVALALFLLGSFSLR